VITPAGRNPPGKVPYAEYMASREARAPSGARRRARWHNAGIAGNVMVGFVPMAYRDIVSPGDDLGTLPTLQALYYWV